jgi:hypothetical protein
VNAGPPAPIPNRSDPSHASLSGCAAPPAVHAARRFARRQFTPDGDSRAAGRPAPKRVPLSGGAHEQGAPLPVVTWTGAPCSRRGDDRWALGGAAKRLPDGHRTLSVDHRAATAPSCVNRAPLYPWSRGQGHPVHAEGTIAGHSGSPRDCTAGFTSCVWCGHLAPGRHMACRCVPGSPRSAHSSS